MAPSTSADPETAQADPADAPQAAAEAVAELSSAPGESSVADGPEAPSAWSAPREYRLVTFEHRPTQADVVGLASAGGRVVSVAPPRSLVVSLPHGTRGRSVAGAVRETPIDPSMKLTPYAELAVAGAAADDELLVFAEYFSDMDAVEAIGATERAGLEVIPRRGLPENVVLARGPAWAVVALTSEPQLGEIVPAPEKFAMEDRLIIVLTETDPEFGVDPMYELVSPGWDGDGLGSADLTYYFDRLTYDLDPAVVKPELVRAMQTWAAYVDITWTEESQPDQADQVEFKWESEGDVGYSFDGPLGVLAHSWYPSPPNSEPLAGDIEFDDEDLWEIGNPGSGMDVYSVALHELGHSLGLGHSSDPSAVMYKYIWSSTVYTGLTADDIAGIQSLYAPRSSGSVVGWASVNTHISVGEVAVPMADGYVESRGQGLHTFQVTFDAALDPASIVGSAPLVITGQESGAVSLVGYSASLDGSGTVMTVALASPLADCDRYTVTVADTVRAVGGGVVSPGQTITCGALKGDADGSGKVSTADLVAIRAVIGQAADATTARYDVCNLGVVTGVDMHAARRQLGDMLP